MCGLEADDLYCHVTLEVIRRMCGLEDVTLETPVKLTVIRHTCGLKDITLETPVKLTEQHKKLLREFEESLRKGGAKHSPSAEGWFKRLHRFLENL